ncbi:MAG: RNA 3'-phosphate cyclase [Planctomycetes bacterium]|nr:RNA 3'-phosphate cyclase [Planctomycetota bacterium]
MSGACSPDPIRFENLDSAGQTFRIAVALAAATGQAFEVRRIWRGAQHPGRHSQNLAIVEAAAAVCGARVEGNELGATRFVFEPGPVVPGDYTFDVGTASAAALLAQVVCLPLVLGGSPSTLTVSGGTHAPFSPPYPYLEDAWVPALRAFGIEVRMELLRPGFFPRGGGALRLTLGGDGIKRSIRLGEMGELEGVNVRSITGNLPFHVGERQLEHAIERLQASAIPAVGGTETLISEAPGAVVQLIGLFSSGQRIVCSSLGKKGQSAEEVAGLACAELLEFLTTRGNVDVHLADQLLLPLALAPEAGEYVAPMMTRDLSAGARVINTFFPGRIVLEPIGRGSVRVRNEPGSGASAGPSGS